MNELAPRHVSIKDPFWTPRLTVYASKAIFHQWEQLEATRCIDNFRIAAGEKQGFREGWFFADSDAYKWLDAASRILAVRPDPGLVWSSRASITCRRCSSRTSGSTLTR